MTTLATAVVFSSPLLLSLSNRIGRLKTQGREGSEDGSAGLRAGKVRRLRSFAVAMTEGASVGIWTKDETHELRETERRACG